MSSGDFAEQLRQSVQDQLALIASAARAAKARIGQGVTDAAVPEPAAAAPPPPAMQEMPADLDFGSPSGPSAPAVDFFAEEPVHGEKSSGDPLFDQAMSGSNGVPDAPISFDNYAETGIDDEGIPVWEDPP